MGSETIVRMMTPDEAQQCKADILFGVVFGGNIRHPLLQLYEGKGWSHWGYRNWRECVVDLTGKSQQWAYTQMNAARIEREIAGINVPRKSAPRKRSTGDLVIYFIRGGDMVKIGITRDVDERLAALQTGSPVPLEVIGVMVGDAALESALHELFAAQRRHGEWFELCDDLARFIQENATHD